MGQWSGEGWSWDIKLWLAAQREAMACMGVPTPFWACSHPACKVGLSQLQKVLGRTLKSLKWDYCGVQHTHTCK